MTGKQVGELVWVCVSSALLSGTLNVAGVSTPGWVGWFCLALGMYHGVRAVDCAHRAWTEHTDWRRP